MTKRSPILGYNHNVRYRGLVFHVQTEDSGVQSPHLFTHMFYGGVIVATRKLVYDVGAVEDVIKNLMQAQHKAVLKELKRGGFDDKIDEYLGTTPGLLPRGAKDPDGAPERPSVVDMSGTPAPIHDEPSEPIELVLPVVTRAKSKPPTPASRTETVASSSPPPPLAAPRTVTASRAPSRPMQPPPPPPLDEPTITDNAAAIAAAVAATGRAPTGRSPTPAQQMPRSPTPVPMPARTSTPSAVPPRAATPPPIPSRTGSQARLHIDLRDSAPEIEITLEPDEARTRSPRDTAVDDSIPLLDEGRATEAHAKTSSELIQSLTPPSDRARNMSDRPASHGAATLPPLTRPVRPPSRQAVTPPTVVTRPVPTEDGRPRRESEVIEVYAPPPPSADAPPGERSGSERPGQYIVNRGKQGKPSEAPPMRADSIPSGLGRPRKDNPSGSVKTQREGVVTGQTPPLPKPGADNLTARPRTPTPMRTPQPVPPRTSSPAGVITTRPAVIVGAPQKPPATPRVRKAREEEGRGFGQGLISEKSLDEVILAYLSEDAEDK